MNKVDPYIQAIASKKEDARSTCDAGTIALYIMTLFFLLLSFVVNYRDVIWFFIATGILYLLYIVYAMTKSPIAKFLANRTGNEDLDELMKKMFQGGVQVKLKSNSYHYSRRGRNRSREKIISHTDTAVFPILSFMDVSGTFKLDKEASNKGYIRLYIDREISFADEVSVGDYLAFKEQFCEKNRRLDDYFELFEKRKVLGMKKYYLVKVGSGCSVILLNRFVYFLLVVLLLPWVYHIIFVALTYKQRFTVRKLVSSRYDLSQSKYATDPKYQNLNPQVDLGKKQLQFERTKTIKTHDAAKAYDLPTEEEIQNAQQFSSYVPNYQFDSYGNALVASPPAANVYDQPYESANIADIASAPGPQDKTDIEMTSQVPANQEQFVEKP